ncbi:MAG: hypothetical protein HF981_03350 [Desulfobacteraceae bacterium]|nr:hypothetical protein [Desulfobacteraceae bacterium]MBC2749403.1 hypothetical protein [Desulfobacteraceae bacterium]
MKFNMIAQYNRFADATRIEVGNLTGACLTQPLHRPDNRSSILLFQ